MRGVRFLINKSHINNADSVKKNAESDKADHPPYPSILIRSVDGRRDVYGGVKDPEASMPML